MNDSCIIEIVRGYSRRIQNGRTLRTISKHAASEHQEFDDEVALVEAGEPEGKDGVVGEAIDVIACMLDAIFVHEPDISRDEIAARLTVKCEKWARNYADSPAKEVLRG